MINRRIKGLSLSLLLLGSLSGAAQIMGQTVEGTVRSTQAVEIMPSVNDRQRVYAGMDAMSGRSGGQTPRKVFEEKMRAAKKYLAPDIAYREKYKTLLVQPTAGIVSLFPEKPCGLRDKVKDCPYAYIYGNARYFSFRSKDYVLDRWADLENLNGFFMSNGLENQGILVNIGDVRLEEVSLDTKGFDFLKNFAPSVKSDEISKQYMAIYNGIEADGFRYAKSLPIEAGKTYGLRVVAYRRDVAFVLNERQKKMVQATPALKAAFDPLTGDRREDVIVAFRVLEKSADGAVTIIWKELARANSPEVVFAGK